LGLSWPELLIVGVGDQHRAWAAYPDEVDAEITAADAAEEAAEQAWLRERQPLAG
jgi:hypothetical protein